MQTPIRFVALAAIFGLLAGLGCERSPEEVEKWRNAKGGMKKMKTWASSADEPMAVRVRAFQVLIEENSATMLGPALEETKDKAARAKLVDGGVSTITKMWEKQDIPKLDEKTEKTGGRVKVGASQAVVAKDAAYYLKPYASGEKAEKLEGILADWLSQDWALRNQLGKTNLGQILPRAGAKGLEHTMTWLEETEKPYKVASLLREKGDDEIKKRVAEIVVKRAEAEHPDVSDSLLAAVVSSKSDAVVPYLKKAIEDPKSSAKIVDQCMEALKQIEGERATTFFSKLIREQKGKLRWAAVNDLVSVRGKGGILSAATSLPLEKETYAHPDEDSFKKDAKWFANFVVSEMKDAGVSTISNTLIRALNSERWPAQVLGLATAQGAHKKDLMGDGHDKVLEAVKNLTSSREKIPGWGEEKRIGEFAHDIADVLEAK